MNSAKAKIKKLHAAMDNSVHPKMRTVVRHEDVTAVQNHFTDLGYKVEILYHLYTWTFIEITEPEVNIKELLC